MLKDLTFLAVAKVAAGLTDHLLLYLHISECLCQVTRMDPNAGKQRFI